jgi:hypothetical protein
VRIIKVVLIVRPVVSVVESSALEAFHAPRRLMLGSNEGDSNKPPAPLSRMEVAGDDPVGQALSLTPRRSVRLRA